MSTSRALAVADPAVGAVLVVAGLIAWRLRPTSRSGIILGATGLCWFAGSFLGAALYLHRGPLVHLQMSYPTGRLRRPVAIAVVAAAYGISLSVVLARNGWVTLALAAIVAVAAFDVFTRSTGPARKAGGPALASALGFAGVLTLSSANRLLDWHADLSILLAYDTAVALIAVVLVADLAWGGWTDATLADLVTGLGRQTDPEGLRGQLQRALGDPSLVLGFWTPEQGGYVDEVGHPIDVPTLPKGYRAVTRIVDQGEPLAVLIHDPAVLDDPRLIAGVRSAAHLAVANARMRASVRVRVTELGQSRRRLVETGDEQSRQLQRELERGAEQRLALVDQLLSVHEGAAQATAAQLHEVRSELGLARVELREFAQGIRPSALGNGGLPAAVPLLAARACVPVTITVEVGRLAATIEAALFFFCSEALANVAKHAQATRAHVDLRIDQGDVIAAVTDDGVGGADADGSGLRGLADRIEALDGTLSVSEVPSGGARLTARIPAAASLGSGCVR